jgi:uncharacterized protein YodC (DUF2158 family)
MEELKAGMVVYLKSGGPAMTIDSINTVSKKCNCTWFDSNGIQMKDHFSPDALTVKNPAIKPNPMKPIS